MKTILVCLFFLVASVSVSADASIWKTLFEAAKPVTKVEKKAIEYGVYSRNIGVLSDAAALRMGDDELKEIDEIVKQVVLSTSKEEIDQTLRGIKELLDAEDGSRRLNREKAIFESDPYLKIRLLDDPKYDDAIGEIARARLAFKFSELFDYKDIRVMIFEMADDAKLSAVLKRDFEAEIPPGLFGASRSMLGAGVGRERQERLIKILSAYRGKTIVAVGHVPDNSRGFFLFKDGTKHEIDIAELEKAAKSAGVNFIPIGCRTEGFAGLGYKGVIQSEDVLKRLSMVTKKSRIRLAVFIVKCQAQICKFHSTRWVEPFSRMREKF